MYLRRLLLRLLFFSQSGLKLYVWYRVKAAPNVFYALGEIRLEWHFAKNQEQTDDWVAEENCEDGKEHKPSVQELNDLSVYEIGVEVPSTIRPSTNPEKPEHPTIHVHSPKKGPLIFTYLYKMLVAWNRLGCQFVND